MLGPRVPSRACTLSLCLPFFFCCRLQALNLLSDALVIAPTHCIPWDFYSPISLAAECQAVSPYPCSFCVAKNKSKGPLPFNSFKKLFIFLETCGVANIMDMEKLKAYITDKLFHKQGSNIAIPILFFQLITLTFIDLSSLNQLPSFEATHSLIRCSKKGPLPLCYSPTS